MVVLLQGSPMKIGCHFLTAGTLLQVRAAKQAVAAGALSSKNVVQPGKRLPSRGTTSLEDDQQEEEDDEPAGTCLALAPQFP